MAHSVSPPVAPMLARLARDLPRDGSLYEPKWDGFRCLVFRAMGEIDLRSRHDRQLARYFPELVEELLAVPEPHFVLDGEIVAERGDFGALLARIHPAASRVSRLRHETPAAFVAFDVLAIDEEDLRERPFAERRARLESLLATAPPRVRLTPATADERIAALWLDEHEGVVAKHPTLPYRAGKRLMVKVKPERTADCVVAGFRWLADRPLPSSLLLGVHDATGVLHHVGSRRRSRSASASSSCRSCARSSRRSKDIRGSTGSSLPAARPGGCGALPAGGRRR